MIDGESCRRYAADCMRQAHNETTASDKTILLNVALAWLRLARQTELMGDAAGDAAVNDAAPPPERIEAGRPQLAY
jgi:hypothetical protein